MSATEFENSAGCFSGDKSIREGIRSRGPSTHRAEPGRPASPHSPKSEPRSRRLIKIYHDTIGPPPSSLLFPPRSTSAYSESIDWDSSVLGLGAVSVAIASRKMCLYPCRYIGAIPNGLAQATMINGQDGEQCDTHHDLVPFGFVCRALHFNL